MSLSPWPVSSSQCVSRIGIDDQAWNLLNDRQQSVLELFAGRKQLQVNDHVLVVVCPYIIIISDRSCLSEVASTRVVVAEKLSPVAAVVSDSI